MSTPEFPYRAAVVMTDALAGHAEDLIEQLTLVTSGKYQFAGGGAGDDGRFTRTHVFCGVKAYTNAVVALELLSTKPIGIGVGHGWVPAGHKLRVDRGHRRDARQPERVPGGRGVRGARRGDGPGVQSRGADAVLSA